MSKHGQACSVIATQLPTELTRREIEDNFGVIGPVKKCHLVRDKDHVFKGVAYVVYTERTDAIEAVNKLNNTTLNERIIKVKLTRERDNVESKSSAAVRSEASAVRSEASQEASPDQEKGIQEKRSKKKKWADKNQKSRNRDGRIIIRNLSFKADEKAIGDHFSWYGEVSEVSILRKSNGKMVGCAFVQYSTRQEALNAIKECNMKPLLGRPIAVDLAVPKEKFASANIKTEDAETESIAPVKNEDPSENTQEEKYDEDVQIKDEDFKEEDFEGDGESDDSGLEEEGDSEEDDEEDEGEDPTSPSKKPFSDGPSKDVEEERTLFMKNLSYEATEEDVKQVLEKYGAVKYVLLCIDHLTQHSRGTAFAQFLEREAADNCLEAEKDPSTKHLFTLHGRPIHIMRALSRQQLQQRQSDEKEDMPKDKRNLYLAREGFIREGTLAAADVSKADMALRVKREQVKRRMLKNLHIFVSPIRLCINNLPKTLTDKELSRTIKTYAPKEATLTETRVMKNLQSLDEDGKPVSRGYGFVAFTKHEHALAALRTLNNNPEVFTNEQKRDEEQEDPEHSSYMGSKSNPSKRDLPSNFGPKLPWKVLEQSYSTPIAITTELA
ncbi:RNA-binding protein 28 [Chionoecetes opilio]|uniref:RNA-binding protein 28 n=1 Tax=Chionoecetes opilio TaxID=41210 RepID=A0A8J4YBP4_CHIOP|nr:RNA-binding protein 28 [Chionoecetes opilio]